MEQFQSIEKYRTEWKVISTILTLPSNTWSDVDDFAYELSEMI